MKARAGRNLAEVTEAEWKLMNGRLEWLGINHYTTWYVTPHDRKDPNPCMFMEPDADIQMSGEFNFLFKISHFVIVSK